MLCSSIAAGTEEAFPYVVKTFPTITCALGLHGSRAAPASPLPGPCCCCFSRSGCSGKSSTRFRRRSRRDRLLLLSHEWKEASQEGASLPSLGQAFTPLLLLLSGPPLHNQSEVGKHNP